ncbi:14831_t:CDS:2 [Acaulospora morrowiae]|uniref:14831_t:CDS:1 n=1 Tax=Acaulospora morrowiae TaxID=94023 RepID=A0A9N8YZD6_9GLOM|nr:14831_t:CDS:2 [Acaulospora morrowiae]
MYTNEVRSNGLSLTCEEEWALKIWVAKIVNRNKVDHTLTEYLHNVMMFAGYCRMFSQMRLVTVSFRVPSAVMRM